CLVVGDLGPRAVAQDPLVDERKMADVQEVLDDARPARLHTIWPRPQDLVGRILEQLERRHVAGWVAEAHPDHAVADRRAVNLDAGFGWRRLLGMRGHEDAPSVGPISPAVIRAFEGAAFDD